MMSATNENHTLIFVHVPKTAGQTVDLILHRQYPSDAIYIVRQDIQASYQTFLDMDPSKRSRYRAIRGHIPYGVHEVIDGPYDYFTFLREPVERTISHFYFLRREPGHPLASRLQEGGMTLDQLIELEIDTMLFNAHTRLYSGVWYAVNPGKCTGEHLEMAKDNLRRKFRVVGLQERFDESLMLLKRAFSWKDLRYQSMNVSSDRPKKEELTESTLELVESANQLDIELYAFAQELFEEQMRGHEKLINRQVKVLRLANTIDRLTFPIRRRSIRTYIKEKRSAR